MLVARNGTRNPPAYTFTAVATDEEGPRSARRCTEVVRRRYLAVVGMDEAVSSGEKENSRGRSRVGGGVPKKKEVGGGFKSRSSCELTINYN